MNDFSKMATELHLNGFFILEFDSSALPEFGMIDDHIWFEPNEPLEKGMLFKVKNDYEQRIIEFFKREVLPNGTDIWGKPSYIESCVNRGVEQASYKAHTDYHEGDIDFFALLYPHQWDHSEHGGLLHIQNTIFGSNFDMLFKPTLGKIVILNNMNPFFKHCVTPITPPTAILNRVLCTTSWKRGNFR